MARIYCECLCIRKAHENGEAATMLASMDKSSVSLKFKYRLAKCLTKRRMGDYTEALANLDTLFDELIEEQSRQE